MAIADRIPVIDTDSHVSEPPDLWSSRLPARWRADAPHVAYDSETAEHRWVVGGKRLSPVGYYAMAGWHAPVPSHPATLDEADPGAWDANARLRRMDEFGIRAQVLYPNVITFNGGAFMRLDRDLGLACTRAYNDFITEFAQADPTRLLPITVLPFWDVNASVAELRRCHDLGHRGFVFAGKTEDAGLPHFADEHWDPLYAAAQELETSLNFHAGFKADGDLEADGIIMSAGGGRRVKGGRERTRGTAANHLAPVGATLSHVLTSGLCDRFPTLQFVSVESGFGYVPYLLESLDWHWRNYGCPSEHPASLLPSEYFRRQVHVTFWYERVALRLLDLYPDNVMFETDYPHPTSLSPGPFSVAEAPRDHIESAFADVDEALRWNVLHANAARVYRIANIVASAGT